MQHMDYEIDRNPAEQPSLKEMVEKALAILDEQSQKTGKNFFLMIEGSRIDMAAHTYVMMVVVKEGKGASCLICIQE